MKQSTQNFKRQRGFTLVEILISVLLLSGSLAAMMTLWSVSRRITERSRDTAEYYAVARQEAERDRAIGFYSVFNSTTNPYFVHNADGTITSTPRYTDYDQNGKVAAQTPATTPYYRARSTYSLEATSGEEQLKRLGVQVIEVFTITNGTVGTTPIYRTTMFFTVVGV